jgi:hypothetical protein
MDNLPHNEKISERHQQYLFEHPIGCEVFDRPLLVFAAINRTVITTRWILSFKLVEKCIVLFIL